MLFHIDPLRLWVHKVLPVVYDDSLSYYEVLAKVTKKLNEVIDLTEEQNQYIEEFSTNLTNAINNWEDGMEREWSSYKSGLNNEWGAFQRNTEQYIENWKNMAESDIEDAIAAGINQFVGYFSDLTQTAVDAAERAMEAAETAAEDAVDAVMPTLESQFDARYAWKTAVGSPLVATTAAGMTDTTKVYVYAGSETGYVNGDWYYYDGTAWQDGGVYNSAAVVTDPTLSESGVPADAKAAGDEIADLKSAITEDANINYVDEANLLSINGATKDADGYYKFTSNSAHAKYNSDSFPHKPFAENTQYTFSAIFKQPASGTYGLQIQFKYTDNTSSSLAIPLNVTTPTEYHMTSTAGKTVSKLNFSYYLATAVYVKDMMVVAGSCVPEKFIPYDALTAIDYTARIGIDNLENDINTELGNIDTKLSRIKGALTALQFGDVPLDSRLVTKRVSASVVFDVKSGIKIESGKTYRISVVNEDALSGATISVRLRNSTNTGNLCVFDFITGKSDAQAGTIWTYYYTANIDDIATLQFYRTYLSDDATIGAGIVWDETHKIDSRLETLTSNLTAETATRISEDGKKVNVPLSNNVPDYGTSGQVLRSLGNGGTEWSDIGSPTDDQTATAVSEWLDEHPEATTTVPDHSLTYSKLINGTLGFVTPQMYGAMADGETDDTSAIQSAFDASHLIYFPDGTYLVSAENAGWGHITEGGVFPRSNTTIILSNAAVLKAKTTSSEFYNILNINNVENVHVFGGKIEGEKNTHVGSTGEFGHGIRISSSANIIIDGVNIFNCWGDAIVISSADMQTNYCENVTIRNCLLHDCRRQGVSIVCGNNTTIDNCEIYNISGTNPQSGINIESNGALTIDTVKIINCYIHDTYNSSILAANDYLKNIFIASCNITAINLNGGEKITISDTAVNTIRLGTDNVKVNGCFIGYIDVESGSGTFNNCDFVTPSDASGCVYFGLDKASTKGKSKGVTFSNCTIDSSASETIYCVNSNGTPGDGSVIFDNSKIKTSGLANRLPYDLLTLKNCEITTTDSIYQLLVVTGADTQLVLTGNKFNFFSAPTYLIASATPLTTFKALITENVIEYSTLINVSNANATGKILMANNYLTGNQLHAAVGDGRNGITIQYSNDNSVSS